jgi:hypothetical protein
VDPAPLHLRSIVAVGALVFALGADVAVTPLQETELPALARALCKDFGGQLKRALTEAIQAEGPIAAIATCSQDAPVIAARIGKESGWTVGRTSLKHRNPANQPDAWERQGLAALDARQAAGEPGEDLEVSAIVESDGQREFRYLKAILTGPLCLNCHGSALAEPVQKALDELYPTDQATGYDPGQVRGAFSLRRTLP